ncbi:MAG: hypothetical protein PHS04_00545 [Tissierellia bacterium]|nr:hypothetical protein [Tissierellia bacterium]
MDKEKFIKELIESQKGKFFTVHFHSKKDGRLCKINGRTGVTKHLKGGKSRISNNPTLKTAYNVKKKGYRTINLSGVIKISCGGKVYEF